MSESPSGARTSFSSTLALLLACFRTIKEPTNQNRDCRSFAEGWRCAAFHELGDEKWLQGLQAALALCPKPESRVQMRCPSSLTHFYSLRTPYLSPLTPMTPFSADHWHSCFLDLVQRFRADCKRSSGLILNACKVRNTEEDTKGAIQHREA